MDRQDYPRTYSIRPEVKRDYSAISLIPIWLALAVTALYCLKLVSPNVTILTLFEIDSFLALTGGLFYWMISSMAAVKVVLHEDSIDRVGPYGTRTLQRSEILGWKALENPRGGAGACVLVPKDNAAKRITFSMALDFDDYFTEWMKHLPRIQE